METLTRTVATLARNAGEDFRSPANSNERDVLTRAASRTPTSALPVVSPTAELPRAWVALFLIVLAGQLAYSDSFQGDFVFDDVQSIPENRDIRSLSPLSKVLTSQRTATVIGRPMLSLSLAFSYAIHRTDVRGYHVFSLTVHLLAALTLFGVLRRAFLLPSIPPRWQRWATVRAAIIALLWVVHPLASSAVLYLVQRAELIAGLTYLLTLYAVLRGATSDSPRLWYTLAVIACATGMAAKETLATAPIAVLLLDRLLLASSWREVFRRRWGLYLGLAATWLELGALVAASHGRKGSAGFGSTMSPWHYLLTQCEALVIYLKLCLWPSPLVFDYGFDVVHSLKEVWWQACVVVLLLAGTVWLLIRRPHVGFPALLFFLILAPTSSFVPLITHTIAEHRMYLPLATVLVLLGLASEEILDRTVSLTSHRGAQQGFLMAVCALVVAWGTTTYRRAADYVTPLSLWGDVVRKRPQNVRGHFNYGAALANRGDAEGSRREFETAVALRPDYADARNNLANYFISQQRLPEALQQIEVGLKLNPWAPNFYFLRAGVRGRMGDFQGALADCNRGIALVPDDPTPYQHRAIALIQLKEYDLARADLETVVRLGGEPEPSLLQRLPQSHRPALVPAPAP